MCAVHLHILYTHTCIKGILKNVKLNFSAYFPPLRKDQKISLLLMDVLEQILSLNNSQFLQSEEFVEVNNELLMGRMVFLPVCAFC